jgi:hypothetical protein
MVAESIETGASHGHLLLVAEFTQNFLVTDNAMAVLVNGDAKQILTV